MQCEVCGRPLRGPSFLVEIDGATLRVCSSCTKFGPKVQLKKEIIPKIKTTKTTTYSSLFKTPSLELIIDYHLKIKNAREKSRLSQEQFGHKINEKPSVIKLLESRKLKPDDILVKKIEHTLKIKLLVPPEDAEPL
jgi:putative transcription factor